MSAAPKEVSQDPQILYEHLSRILEKRLLLLHTLVHARASLAGVTSGEFSSNFDDLHWVNDARLDRLALAESAVKPFGPENKVQITHRAALLIELLRDDFVVELVADCRLSLACLRLLHVRLEKNLVKLAEAIVLLVAMTNLLENEEETQIADVVVLLANCQKLDSLEDLEVHGGTRVIGAPTHKNAGAPTGN